MDAFATQRSEKITRRRTVHAVDESTGIADTAKVGEILDRHRGHTPLSRAGKLFPKVMLTTLMSRPVNNTPFHPETLENMIIEISDLVTGGDFATYFTRRRWGLELRL